jgi:hypothetical protein
MVPFSGGLICLGRSQVGWRAAAGDGPRRLDASPFQFVQPIERFPTEILSTVSHARLDGTFAVCLTVRN